MMKFFRIGFGSPAMSQLFNQYPNLFEKAKAKTTIGLDNLRSFASVYRTMPFSNSEMFLAACGDPCKPVNEARFDNIPKSGEVLRYLPIYTPIPDPYFSSKIKAEYRCFLSYSSDSRHISFLRSISSLQDFSFHFFRRTVNAG